MLEKIKAAGYEQSGYGYKKTTDIKTHWITLFEDGTFQMYCYYTDDTELEKVYDTGVIEASYSELETLINVLAVNNQ